MNGVTILNTKEVSDVDVAGIILSIIFLIVSIVFLVSIIKAIIDSVFLTKGDYIICAISSTMIMFMIVGSIICLIESADTTIYKEYEVAVDDNVGINDFMDKYEIVEQRGEIYVVKEIDK